MDKCGHRGQAHDMTVKGYASAKSFCKARIEQQHGMCISASSHGGPSDLPS